MASDLQLTGINAPLTGNNLREQGTPTPRIEKPELVDENFEDQFETPDVSDQKRDAFKEALDERKVIPEGRLVIEQDEDTGKFVQKVLNKETGEVIQQWPEEQFLELAKSMDKAYGLLFDKTI